jgi:transposase-like protein
MGADVSFKHGTRSAWFNHGCRCDACWDARLEYDRNARRKRREKFAAGKVEVSHGKAWVYSEYRCRCDLCVAAHNAYEVTRRRGKGVAPARRFSDAEKDKAIRLAHEQGTAVAAETIGVGQTTVSYWARSAGCPIPRRQSEHGTRSRYNAGCRCEACTTVNRVVTYARIDETKRRAAAGLVEVPHGTTNGYRNYGCRCEECTWVNTYAGRLAQQRYRERQQAKKQGAS